MFLILPENQEYKKNSEYLFFSNKKENIKIENLNSILSTLDLNIDKIKNFDLNKEIQIKTQQDKFNLFNSPLGVNTNQNANPIIKLNNDENKQIKEIKQLDKVQDETIAKKSIQFKKII